MMCSVKGCDFKTMSVEAYAAFLHLHYELCAKKSGWSTQESCRVSFVNLPKENKLTMILLAETVLQDLMIAHETGHFKEMGAHQ